MKLLHWLDENIEKIFILFTTMVMLCLLATAVFSRYVMNMSITWAEEISLFGMVWLVYFGASYAAKYRRHIRITIIRDMLPIKTQKLLDIFLNIIFFVFMAFLLYGSINMTILAYETKQAAAASGFPRWIGIAALPVAFTLTCIRLVQDTKKLCQDYSILAAGGTIEEDAPVISIKMED
jgi:TRAP-type C4-dicarboxylate transport system permease small subunit